MHQIKLELNDFETIQRAENGGSPLSNDSAHELGVGHGMELAILPKRKLIALIRCLRQEMEDAGLGRGRKAAAIDAYLNENDSFVLPVKSKEIWGENE